MIKFDRNVIISDYLTDYYNRNKRFPKSESEFMEWLDHEGLKIHPRVVQRGSVNWGVKVDSFVSGKKKLFLSVEDDPKLSDAINRYARRTIQINLIEAERGVNRKGIGSRKE